MMNEFRALGLLIYLDLTQELQPRIKRGVPSTVGIPKSPRALGFEGDPVR